MTKGKLMKALEDKWGFQLSGTDEFYGDNSNGIWVRSSESSTIDGLPVFDYNAWSHDPKEETYTMGVLNVVREFLSKAGWYAECYDPGTYMLWEM
jgi:hypothetical protein